MTTLVDYIRGSIRRQFVGGVVLVQIVLSVGFVWNLVSEESRYLEKSRLSRAVGTAEMLATSSSSWVLSRDVHGLREMIVAAARMPALRYAIFLTPDGRVLAHTDERQHGLTVADAGGRALLQGPETTRVIATTDQAVDVAAPIIANGRLVGWSWISLSRADDRATVTAALWKGAAFGLLGVLGGALIAAAMAAHIARGLRRLAAVSERFRSGDHDVRVTVDRRDEVGKVARGVNAMLETVADTERSLQTANRIARIGFWRCSLPEGVLSWSDEVYDMFGLEKTAPAPSLEGFLASLSSTDQEAVRKVIDPDHPKASFTLQITARRPDGAEVICWSEGRSEFDEQGKLRGLIGISQDVTERESAAAQLRQAQKMEAVGQLTGGLAHDFNNLLAIVIGNLDLLDGALDHDSEAREFSQTALEAALKGAQLTQQLLAFSRRQPLRPQTVDANQLLAQMGAIWTRTLGGSVVVRLHTASDLWPVSADPSQLEAALLNLAINGRDAMEGRGVLTIESRNVQLDTAYAEEHPEVAPGDYAMISVSDTGSGISPDVLSRVFEPFFTTKGVGLGSGLGLSMVYGFVKQSGGHVKIYSEVGHGTTIRLYLPRAAEAHEAPAQRDAPPPRADGEIVLLVEDNEQVRRVALRQLADLGYQVLAAENGESALRVVETQPRIDLLFTDIVMPGGMTGLELVDAARARLPALKVLYTTGFTEAAAASGGNFTGEDLLLTKPYRSTELARKVREVLDA